MYNIYENVRNICILLSTITTLLYICIINKHKNLFNLRKFWKISILTPRETTEFEHEHTHTGT